MLIRKSKKYSARLPIRIKDWKLFKGDNVMVVGGGHKGEFGMITAVDEYKSTVVVEGVKMRRKIRHGKFVLAEQSMHYSNVLLIDPETKKPTRVKWRYTEEGERVRIAVRSGAMIPVPDQSQFEPPPAEKNADKNTDMAEALRDTYSIAVQATQVSE
jgi:large subunit ribosomal protein L24